MSRSDPPAGVARLFKRRARRIVATYLLGHDRSVAILPRIMARTLSAYERSTVRAVFLVLVGELPLFDDPVLWVARRIAFRLAGRPRGDDDPALDRAPPGSGWRGNLLALASWAGLIAGAVWLAPH